jgi:paraquat-inducible protein A
MRAALTMPDNLQTTEICQTQIQCLECALTVNVPILKEKQKAQCPRCGYTLSAIHRNANQRIIAFSITALIFLIASLPFKFLSFSANGLENHFDAITSFFVLIDNDYQLLALIEFLTIFAIPTVVLLSLIYLLIPMNKGLYPKHARKVLNMVFTLIPWSMVEIFLIGALVSLIKIISMADIALGLSFYAFILFALSMTIVILHIDKRELYQLLAQIEKEHKIEIKQSQSGEVQASSNTHALSVQKTWALLLTAVVLYIPANTFPIMTTHFFGQNEASTIIGGVILLWKSGSYPIAAIVFIASVIIPVAKILVLAWLNYSVQKQSHRLSLQRVKWYRMAEFVGRWSMIDVFVVIILASLIQLGPTMSITPGAATLAFSGLVIVTMLAAMSFEPQLIWNDRKKYE